MQEANLFQEVPERYKSNVHSYFSNISSKNKSFTIDLLVLCKKKNLKALTSHNYTSLEHLKIRHEMDYSPYGTFCKNVKKTEKILANIKNISFKLKIMSWHKKY